MILIIGHCCVDDIYHVLKYPDEDSTVGSTTQHNRCTKQTWARGGNASNNATILSCLGQSVEYFGTLANDHLLSFFTEDMKSYGIKYDNCPIIDGVGRAPASVVLCSEDTGTRTIVHCKGNLPELTLKDFETRIDLKSYTWLHFEGRSEETTEKMLQLIHIFNSENPKLQTEENTKGNFIPNYRTVMVPISVEVEKRKETLLNLIPLAHVLFVGKDVAEMLGAKDCQDAAKMFSKKVQRGTVLICPWGDQGAAFCVSTGSDNVSITKVDAFPPTKIIDSLGAGDTFVASTIFCLHKGMDIETSVRIGCRIASLKLEMYGFRGIKEKVSEIPELKN